MVLENKESELEGHDEYQPVLWTDEEFQRVAFNTRLSENTLKACREVLVNGLSGVDSSMLHGVKTPQISRGLKTLRSCQEVLLAKVEVELIMRDNIRPRVVKAAREIAGRGLEVIDPELGFSYEGEGIVKMEGYFVQNVAAVGVLHDMGKLAKEPELNENLDIAYPVNGGMASVRVIPVQLEVKSSSRGDKGR